MPEFHDYLPAQCPPSDAYFPQNQQFFRVVSDPISDNDFIPLGLQGNRTFLAEEVCIYKGLSLMSAENEAKNLLGLPLHKGKQVASGMLNNTHGVVKQTPNKKNKSHHTRWHFITVNPKDIFDI